jgi:hypothetical protein
MMNGGQGSAPGQQRLRDDKQVNNIYEDLNNEDLEDDEEE